MQAGLSITIPWLWNTACLGLVSAKCEQLPHIRTYLHIDTMLGYSLREVQLYRASRIWHDIRQNEMPAKWPSARWAQNERPANGHEQGGQQAW